MNNKRKHIILYCIRITLMVFWLYVALDKLWNLDGFHASLLKQPFPNWWADVLFWLLPIMELGVAILFALRRFRSIPYLLSALLMFVFTVYIGLGVAGLYAKRPCSCASVFHGMSWERHLRTGTMPPSRPMKVPTGILSKSLNKPGQSLTPERQLQLRVPGLSTSVPPPKYSFIAHSGLSRSAPRPFRESARYISLHLA